MNFRGSVSLEQEEEAHAATNYRIPGTFSNLIRCWLHSIFIQGGVLSGNVVMAGQCTRHTKQFSF